MAAKKLIVEEKDYTPDAMHILAPYLPTNDLVYVSATSKAIYAAVRPFRISRLTAKLSMVVKDSYPNFDANGADYGHFTRKYTKHFGPFQFEKLGLAAFIGAYCVGLYNVRANRIWYTPNEAETESEAEPAPEKNEPEVLEIQSQVIQSLPTTSLTGEAGTVHLKKRVSLKLVNKRVRLLKATRRNSSELPSRRADVIEADDRRRELLRSRSVNIVEVSPSRVHRAWRVIETITGSIRHFTSNVRGVHHFYTMSTYALNATWNIGVRMSSFYNEHYQTMVDLGLQQFMQDYMNPGINATMAIEAPAIPE